MQVKLKIIRQTYQSVDYLKLFVRYPVSAKIRLRFLKNLELYPKIYISESFFEKQGFHY